jgi:hypothetical protein
MLGRCRRVDAAIDALKQGCWLHRRAGQHRRAAVVSSLIEQLQAGDFPRAA